MEHWLGYINAAVIVFGAGSAVPLFPVLCHVFVDRARITKARMPEDASFEVG